MIADLRSPVSLFNQIAAKLSSKLKKLGIETIEDLLFYYPFRYDDFSQILDIKDLTAGTIATIRGKVQLIENQRSWRRRVLITECIVNDITGSVKVIWFGQPYVAKILKSGDEVFISGRVDYNKGLFFSSPSYEKVTQTKEEFGTTHTARLVPVYNLTKGITSKQLRYLIKMVLSNVSAIREYLPGQIIRGLKFPGLAEAIKQIHFPDSKTKLDQAQKRLKFDEFFLIQLKNQLARQKLNNSKATSVPFASEVIKKWVTKLPFKLTDAQRRSAWEILQDLSRDRPMNRLLEGDVGSGKTVVAAMAMLDVVQNNLQVALMAPTEILAKQHYHTITKLFSDFDFKIGLMTRTQGEIFGDGRQDKKDLIKKIKSGKIKVVIGTHALIQEKVYFYNLALAIVDEQHRFGVQQRKALQQKSGHPEVLPHFLSMTATPIPRSLALTIYGDLDISIIDQMPAGRKKVITKIVQSAQRDKAYRFIRQEIVRGRQVFVICPLIDPSDKLGFKSVREEAVRLDKKIFPEFKIAVLHGRLKSEEKEMIMRDFSAGKINILVSTSVVEVGVDVPNATVMMIEGADRFGLAQLHQFRGRVGRGQDQSYCFLFSQTENDFSKERLAALVSSSDGFKLAEQDLRFRGPGETLGTVQSGMPDLHLANLFDFAIIKQAREWSERIIAWDPDLQKNPNLKQKIGDLEDIHLE
ncbi:MAG: ATP-dependent DNA helicase RecG [Patescibacteria group bacterium]